MPERNPQNVKKRGLARRMCHGLGAIAPKMQPVGTVRGGYVALWGRVVSAFVGAHSACADLRRQRAVRERDSGYSTSPWRIVFSDTVRGSTKCSR